MASHSAEIVGGVTKPAAKVELPDAVYDTSPSQRVVGVGQPVGQRSPPIGLLVLIGKFKPRRQPIDCSERTGADFMFAWPMARICIVGAETAASIIFAREIKEAEDPKAMKAQRIAEYRDLFENPYCAAERGFIDDVIMPSETRKYINRALDVTENKSVVRPWRKYSNINL